MSRRKGFTLIELLVVVAILAILAAVLIPVFSRARAKARQATCLSNLKQLALGVMMYASNWDGCAPGIEHPWATFADSNWPRNEYVLWSVLIDPYVENREIYGCPAVPHWCLAGTRILGMPNRPSSQRRLPTWFSNNEEKITEPCASGVPIPHDWVGVSMGYAMNPLIQLSVPIPYQIPDASASWFDWEGMVSMNLHPSTGYGGRNFARLQRPGEVMMLSDTNNIADNCANKSNYASICGAERTPCIDEDEGNNYTPVDARHRGGNNYAFCDGHVEWIPANTFLCNENGMGADTETILRGRTMQRLHGIDQLR